MVRIFHARTVERAVLLLSSRKRNKERFDLAVVFCRSLAAIQSSLACQGAGNQPWDQVEDGAGEKKRAWRGACPSAVGPRCACNLVETVVVQPVHQATQVHKRSTASVRICGFQLMGLSPHGFETHVTRVRCQPAMVGQSWLAPTACDR